MADRSIAVDRALTELEKIDKRLCLLIELRFYNGHTLEQTAEIMELSPATVQRDWEMARAFLSRAMQ